LQREHGIVRRQEQGVSIPARHVLDLRIGLTLIRLKSKRKGSVAGLNSTARGGRSGYRLGCDRRRRSLSFGLTVQGRGKHKQAYRNDR
jgi:hypothetical protein